MRAVSIFAAAYLSFGALCGLFLAHIIPAVNALGVAYYAATWPAFFAAGMFGDTGVVAQLGFPDPPIPAWCFTFEEPAQALTGGRDDG